MLKVQEKALVSGVKLNMQVVTLALNGQILSVEQPRAAYGEGSTLISASHRRSNAPTLNTQRISSTKALEEKSKSICDPLVMSPEVRKANEILKNH